MDEIIIRSRAVYLNCGDDTERVLITTIDQIEALSLAGETPLKTKPVSKRKQYLDLLKVIDDMSVQLRLHQAQLLKNLTIYDRMGDLIRDCTGRHS